MAKICLCLGERTINANRPALAAGGFDLVELRLDLLAPSEFAKLEAFCQEISAPILMTCRRLCDGGEFSLGEDRRVELLERVLDYQISYIDLEEDLDREDLYLKARSRGIRILRSLHDFNGIGIDTIDRIKKLRKHADEIVKLAIQINSIADLQALLRISRLFGTWDKVFLGMGEYGIPSRILAEHWGSMWTYAHAGKKSLALGQLSVEELNSTYRFREISLNTQILGVIGKPIAQSKSPIIHNRFYRRLGWDAVYIRCLVDDLEGFFSLAQELDIRGVSVTIPYKKEIMQHVQKFSLASKTIGACNTIIKKKRDFIGINTDTTGFMRSLKNELGHDKNLAGKKVAIIGAGGAAQGIAFAFYKEGAQQFICNRSVDKAVQLAHRFKAQPQLLDEGKNIPKDVDIIVQCTSLGMFPDTSDPIPSYKFSGKELVYDIVYKPEYTRLLTRAEKSGCHTVSGLKMLDEQAYEQVRLFYKHLSA